MAFAVLRFPHNLRWIFSLHKKHIRTHDTTGVDVFRFIIVNTCLVDYNDLRATKTLSFFGRSKAFLSFGWDAAFSVPVPTVEDADLLLVYALALLA
jgi:hypothetical protein